MSVTDDIDRKRTDLRRIVSDMRGISPKLELYKKLAKDAERLQIELSAMGAKRIAKKK